MGGGVFSLCIHFNMLIMAVIPLPGKASRVGASSEGDDVVMSSGQQLGKPYKIGSQVTVVTKPVAVSSVSAASHVSHLVRTLKIRTVV